MTQCLAVRADGSLVGIVMDSSPLMPARAVEAWWAGGTGVRCRRDLMRAAVELDAAIVVEIVHRPARSSSSGRSRRYPETTYCRVIHVAADTMKGRT